MTAHRAQRRTWAGSRALRAVLALVVALTTVLAVAGVATAFYAGSGSGSDTSASDTVLKANAPDATAGVGTVQLSWAASTLASGAPVTGYRVYRHLSSGPTLLVCTVLAPTTSCADGSPVASTVSYGVVAAVGSWSGPESDLTSFTYDNISNMPYLTAITNDSGSSSTDRITNVATQNLLGSADPGDTVTVKKDDAGPVLCTAVANGSGSFSCGPVTLAEGANSYVARAYDANGNNSAPSTPLSVTLDTTTVTPTFTGISADSGSSATDEITKVASQMLQGTAEPLSTVTVGKSGFGFACSTTADGAGNFSCGPVTLTTGLNVYVATTVDPAGNGSPPSFGFPVTLDQANSVTITGISADTGPSGTDARTATATQNLVGTTDPNSSVTITKGGTTVCSATANGSGVFSCGPVTLVEGPNAYVATSVDPAGNSATSATFTATLDTQIATPVISRISPDSGVVGDGITNVAATTVSGTAEAGSQVVVRRSGSVVCSTTADPSGAWACAFTLTSGANSLVATSTDLAGNQASSATFTATLDTTAAAPTFTSISAETGQFPNDQITKTAAQTLTGAAEPNSAVVVKKGTTTLCTTTANGSGVFTCAVTLVEGTNTYTATQTDVAGNTSASSAGFPVVLDTVQPTITNVMANRSPLTWTNNNNGSGSWNGAACAGNQICATILDTGGSGFSSGAPVLQISGSTGANAGKCYNSTTNTFQASCFAPVAYNSGTGLTTVTIAQSLMLDGTYLYTMNAVDLAGNQRIVTVTLTIT